MASKKIVTVKPKVLRVKRITFIQVNMSSTHRI